MEANPSTSADCEWDPKDFIEERYPKRSRKNKIDDLSQLDEPEPYDEFGNKAERLCKKLPYPIEEILDEPKYVHDDIVITMPIREFTMEYIKKSGLLRPLLFSVPPEQLGMKMPNPDEFGVSDVLELIGGERRIEVVEVYEQKGTYMLLKDFVDYYKQSASERNKLLNVLSLEFTNTKLAEKVSAPAFVSEIDWIDNVWPKELFARQENLLQRSSWARTNDFSTYPKVQRYCLMSVENCFTDFHIDFGGTSVWYHILKGEKIFWMIEPTEFNLGLYEKWILNGNGNENSIFFGKLTEKCTRVRLCQGDTLVIPSGWIHCVYTPVDSLVFGGNFLHSYSIPMQIRVSKSEDRIKIGSKYRFPHFKQMFWCFIAQIVRNATHRIYQKKLPMEAHGIEGSKTSFEQRTSKLDKNVEEEGREINNSAAKSASPDSNAEEDPASVVGMDVQSPNDGQTSQLTTDGEEICYDDSLGNAIDGLFTFNPIQSVYDREDEAQFTPAQNYDIDYLRSLPSMVVNGLFSLLSYAKKLLHHRSKQPEVIEGITRPHHLVSEFKALLDKICEIDLVSVRLETAFSPMDRCESTEFTLPAPKEAPVSLSTKGPPKDERRKMKRHGTVDEAVQKKALKKKNVSTPTTFSGPVLIGGLPLPTHLHTPSSSGSFNPMGEIVKLGQRPMQSAWRKAKDMAEPPPPTHIHQIKKRFELSTSNADDGQKYTTNDSFEEMEHDAGQQNAAVDDTEFTTQSTSEGAFGKERKMGSQRHYRKAIPKVVHNKLIEIHDDSPEFSHRSPLQRIRGRESKAPNQFHSNSNAFNPRSFSNAFASSNNDTGTPRNEMFGHQRNGTNNWRRGWGESRGGNNANDNFRPHSKSWNSFGGGGRGEGEWRRASNGRGGYRQQQQNRNSSREWDSNLTQHRWSTDGNNDGGFGESRNEWSSFGNQSYDDTGFSNTVSSGPTTGFGSWTDTSANFSQRFDNPDKSEANGGGFETVGFGSSSQSSTAFEQQSPFAFKPSQQQQQPKNKYGGDPPYPTQVPISNTVNELHHISQIMNGPSSVGLNDEMSIDQIPLPPTDRFSSAVSLPRFSRFAKESEQQQSSATDGLQQQSADPFADVDELENITRMMQ